MVTKEWVPSIGCGYLPTEMRHWFMEGEEDVGERNYVIWRGCNMYPTDFLFEIKQILAWRVESWTLHDFEGKLTNTKIQAVNV